MQKIRQCKDDITGYADLNQHLYIIDLRQDSGCPLCQEDEDTILHFIVQYSALMLLWKNILRDYTLL